MQLNEVIEENSIATISKRTRISVENIERLVQRDFSHMKRVQALGFISILEREFGISLDSLKKECSDYFSLAPEEEFDARLVVTIPESGEPASGIGSKLLMLLLLFGIGYGAWYFLVNKEQINGNDSTISTTGFVGSIVNQAKAWLSDSSTLNGDTASNQTEGVWAKGEREKNSTAMTVAGQTITDEKKANEKNDSATEEQIIREAKQEQKQILAQAAEPQDAMAPTMDMMTDAPQEKTTVADDTPALAPEEDTLATGVPSMADTVPAEATTALEKVLPPEVKVRPKKKTAPKTTNKVPMKKAKGKQVVILHPIKRVWVGYTDLSTMKRAAKVIEEDLDFDTSSGSWILVAGHNAIDFMVKGKTITPKKRDKNYFLIEKGKVKEISKETFQKLNKSTVW